MRFWKKRPIDGDPLVGIAIASYQPNLRDRRSAAFRALLSSLAAQTYTRFRVEVTHDGPPANGLTHLVEEAGVGANIEIWCAKKRHGEHGHPHRQGAIERLLAKGCDWILLTNDDNYYVPVFLEAMLTVGTRAPKPRLVHSDMLHSHRNWAVMATRPKAGAIDLGSCLAHRSLVERVRFADLSFRGDGIWIEKLAKEARGKIGKVPLPLFVHN